MSLLSGSSLAVWVSNLPMGFGLPVGGHFIMSLLSGSSLAVWVLNLPMEFGLTVGGHFHNELSFWGKSPCLGFELTDGIWFACWGTFS